MPTTAGAGQAQSWETNSVHVLHVGGRNTNAYCLILPPGDCIRRKLKSGIGAGVEPRYSDMRCEPAQMSILYVLDIMVSFLWVYRTRKHTRSL